jgi:multiple sugar transport system substrate-binding protein
MRPTRSRGRSGGALGRALAVLGVALGAASCGDAERGQLEVQASPYIKPVYEKVVTEFTTAHQATPVGFVAGPREEDQLVQQLLRTKLVGGVLPDVVFISGNLVRTLVERGLAVPLDAFIDADPDFEKGNFSPAVAAAGRVQGKTFGLAYGFSMPVVLFNAQLVRRAGADPNALPTDWAGIVALAQRIDKPEAGTVGGFVEYDNGGAFSFLFMLNSYGGRLLTNDERSVAFGDDRGLKSLSVFRDFGHAGQAHADMTRDQARQAFGAGGIGVFVTMSSMIPRLEAAAAGRFDVLAVPLPVEAADGKVPAAGPVAVMLTQNKEKQRAAFELMKFACGPQGQTILVQGSGYAPANEAALRNVPSLRALLAARRNAHAYLARLGNATDWYAPPGPNTTRITDAIVVHLQQVVTLETTPEAALQAMRNEVQALLPPS